MPRTEIFLQLDREEAIVPEVSRFFGIVITMYYDDHPPPHFHAKYGSEAQFLIDPPGLHKGQLSRGPLPW